MNVWNEWRRPVCEPGDRDLPGEDWAGAMHARKADLDVQTTLGCWVSEKELEDFYIDYCHRTDYLTKGSFIKKKDGLSPTYLKTPPPRPPPNVDYVFFHHCFIVLFQYLDIFFYIKSKNNT